MTLWLAAIALIAAFLIQNLAELRGGGPPVPPFLASRGTAATARLRRRAVAIVSFLVPLLLLAGLLFDWNWLVLMLAGALAANAILQAAISLWKRQLVPGTIPGIALMLPASIWLIAELGTEPYLLLWLSAGVAVTAPLLLLVWLIAARDG
ncbi:hypothetical protein FQV27_11380 [Paracoccus aurantiacus]|uniref:HXXEE domain-containing protein n=1 Tax=Paracoccus aurantiacus TaxID=2599412 RepID=A0A5C6S284_9RHOB|nr:hypothetical protein [Paracoccus aurantiacus]TXB68582.1 hypothetical protein FQV27_11380 [Paracoccus aurantiacus]